MVNGVRTRFHKMWDGAVISNKHKGCSPIQLAEEFDIFSDEQIAKIQRGTPDDWHIENVAISEKVIQMIPKSKKITYDNYLNEAIKYAEDRITVAGYRLASILNSIFDK